MLIERFNRTIKEKMFRYFSANNTSKYVGVLNLLVEQYNNTIHSAIKMTPKEASRKENENKVWRNLYPEFGGKILSPKCSIGDKVRITMKKNLVLLRKSKLKCGEICILNLVVRPWLQNFRLVIMFE